MYHHQFCSRPIKNTCNKYSFTNILFELFPHSVICFHTFWCQASCFICEPGFSSSSWMSVTSSSSRSQTKVGVKITQKIWELWFYWWFRIPDSKNLMFWLSLVQNAGWAHVNMRWPPYFQGVNYSVMNSLVRGSTLQPISWQLTCSVKFCQLCGTEIWFWTEQMSVETKRILHQYAKSTRLV